MPIFRVFALMCCFSLSVLCQDGGRNTITAGIGGGFPTGGEQVFLTNWGIHDSAAFSGSYEYRLFKYFAPEVGVVNLIPLVDAGGKYPQPPMRERVTLLSLGVRGILPLKQGWVELFAGAAAVHVSSSYYVLTESFLAPSWLWQINGGGRFAMDKRHRFWIGPTVRFSRNGGRPTEEWVSLTGDFGFRF